MKKTLIGFAVAVLLAAGTLTATAATSNKTTTSGSCYNGATWTLTLTRSGSKVAAAFTIAGMPKQIWNINWAWTPTNRVYNQQVKPDSKGRFTVKDSTTSSAPVTAFVLVDEPWAYTQTCIAGATI